METTESICDFDQGQIRNVESSPSARTKEPLLGVCMDSGVVLGAEASNGNDSTGELLALETAAQKQPVASVEVDAAVLGSRGLKGLVRSKVTEEACSDGAEEKGEEGGLKEECPICTDPYEAYGVRGQAVLNCDHAVCHSCLEDMQKRAADGSRVCCPLCRQKTPLLSWEIRQMQEEAVSLMGGSYSGPGPTPAISLAPSLPPAEPGVWAALQRRLDSRMETASVCGCFSYPPGLVRAIQGLRFQCRCCYFAGLLLLYLVEISCLLLVFLPVLVLVLLFTLASK